MRMSLLLQSIIIYFLASSVTSNYENIYDIERIPPSEYELHKRNLKAASKKKCQQLFDTHYDSQNLKEYKPLDILLNTDYVEEGLCEFKFLSEGGGLSYADCDVDMRTKFNPSKAICIEELSGRKKFIDIKISCQSKRNEFESTVTFRNIHFCGGPGCGTVSLGKVLEERFQEIVDTVSNTCQINVDSSKEGRKACKELPTDKFTMKDSSGRIVKNTCMWLIKRDQEKKRNICSQIHSDEEAARFVCPSTCCTCDENPTAKFLKMRIPNTANPTKEWKAVTQSCNWLKRQPIEQRDKYCDKRISLNNFLPAVSICPETCESCPQAKSFASRMDIRNGIGMEWKVLDPFHLFKDDAR